VKQSVTASVSITVSSLAAVIFLAACNASGPSVSQGSAQVSAAQSGSPAPGPATTAEADGISVTLHKCRVSVQAVTGNGTAKVFSTQATVVNHNSSPTYDAPDFIISMGAHGYLGSITYQLGIPQPVGVMPASESHLAAWYGEDPGVNAALNRQPYGPVPCSVTVAPSPSG
jgi:hypothetical protein